MVEPITDDLRREDGLAMTSWLRAWYYRYKENKKRMRGNLETNFNDLLEIKAVIGKYTMYGKDYVGKMWEGT